MFLLSTAGILSLKIVCFLSFSCRMYLVVVFTTCNFEVDLQYWGELLDIVKMEVELIQIQLLHQLIGNLF